VPPGSSTWPRRLAADLLVHGPFALTGTLHGQSLVGPDSIDLDIAGYGMMTAEYRHTFDGRLELSKVTYEVDPIPEPTTLLLVGAGLAGIATGRGRYRSRMRSAGSASESIPPDA
jgi:PEP-CTERM motif